MEDKEWMKTLAMIGSILAFIEAFAGLFGSWGLQIFFGFQIFSSTAAIGLAIIALLSVFSPGKPIPYNPKFLMAIGVLLLIFSSFIGGVLVIIGGYIGGRNK